MVGYLAVCEGNERERLFLYLTVLRPGPSAMDTLNTFLYLKLPATFRCFLLCECLSE